jgi:hypothetical protein
MVKQAINRTFDIMGMRDALALEPFRKVVESGESDVIHCRAPESKEGARCGSLNTGERRSAAACDIPAI